jgi:hypothetical protein
MIRKISTSILSHQANKVLRLRNPKCAKGFEAIYIRKLPPLHMRSEL